MRKSHLLDDTMRFIGSKIANEVVIQDINQHSTDPGCLFGQKATITISEVEAAECSLKLFQKEVRHGYMACKGTGGRPGYTDEEYATVWALAVGNFIAGSARATTSAEALADSQQNRGYVVKVNLKNKISRVQHVKKIATEAAMGTLPAYTKTTRDEDITIVGTSKAFYFTDQETAVRVAKAIDHAGKLCGASKEPF